MATKLRFPSVSKQLQCLKFYFMSPSFFSFYVTAEATIIKLKFHSFYFYNILITTLNLGGAYPPLNISPEPPNKSNLFLSLSHFVYIQKLPVLTSVQYLDNYWIVKGG